MISPWLVKKLYYSVRNLFTRSVLAFCRRLNMPCLVYQLCMRIKYLAPTIALIHLRLLKLPPTYQGCRLDLHTLIFLLGLPRLSFRILQTTRPLLHRHSSDLCSLTLTSRYPPPPSSSSLSASICVESLIDCGRRQLGFV